MQQKIVLSADIALTTRPRTKFNPEVVQILLNAIADGLSDIDACRVANISRPTFDRWLREEQGFSEAMQVAEAEYKRSKLLLIAQAGTNTNYWAANGWLLERKFPDEYGKRTAMDVTSGGQPLKAYIGFSPDEWDGPTIDASAETVE